MLLLPLALPLFIISVHTALGLFRKGWCKHVYQRGGGLSYVLLASICAWITSFASCVLCHCSVSPSQVATVMKYNAVGGLLN